MGLHFAAEEDEAVGVVPNIVVTGGGCVFSCRSITTDEELVMCKGLPPETPNFIEAFAILESNVTSST